VADAYFDLNRTPAGRRQLKTEVAELRQYMGVLFRVLDTA